MGRKQKKGMRVNSLRADLSSLVSGIYYVALFEGNNPECVVKLMKK